MCWAQYSECHWKGTHALKEIGKIDTFRNRKKGSECNIENEYCVNEYFNVYTTGKFIRSIKTVRVVVTLLFLGYTMVVTTAELVRKADG